MKVKVKVHPNSSKEEVRKTNNGYEVWFSETPVGGKANAKLLKMLKDYFKKSVKITSGKTSRNKIVEVSK